ncbi:unnamed protein product [Allacma fusca]|uniref:Uncharacterized protein n=1 Tax=Allacma fusca TaxID=39272 RepID=A0A8J2KCI5_9HEXA|nr:unnamed protein product [Allacma fusca]
MRALGKDRRCSKQTNPALKTYKFLPKKSRIKNILVTFKPKGTKEDRLVKLRARMNKLFPGETKIFKKRVKPLRTEKITFIREYNSVLSDISIINYGIFYWDGKHRILQPATNSSKLVWAFSALVSVLLLFAYTSAMILSDYVDVSKLEIRNLAVISSDEIIILAQVYMLALELNSFYFNSQIIESINAKLQLQEYASKCFSEPY